MLALERLIGPPLSAGSVRSDSFYQDFWAHLIKRHPEEDAGGKATKQPYRWRAERPGGLVVSQYLAPEKYAVGVYTRGEKGVPIKTVLAPLEPHTQDLEARFGVKKLQAASGQIAIKTLPAVNVWDLANWNRIADWLHAEADAYEAALREVLDPKS